MALEGIDVRGPMSAKLREPDIDLLKRLGPKSIHAALRIDRNFDEARLA